MFPEGAPGFATIPRTLKLSGNSPGMFFDVLADAAGEAPGPGKQAAAARDPAMIQPCFRIRRSRDHTLQSANREEQEKSPNQARPAAPSSSVLLAALERIRYGRIRLVASAPRARHLTRERERERERDEDDRKGVVGEEEEVSPRHNDMYAYTGWEVERLRGAWRER